MCVSHWDLTVLVDLRIVGEALVARRLHHLRRIVELLIGLVEGSVQGGCVG